MVRIFAASAVLFTCVSASAAAVDLSSLQGVGSAQLGPGGFILTTANAQAGAGWLSQSISTSSSFTATFSFYLDGEARPQGDGLGLVLQNRGTNVVGAGGSGVGFEGLNGVGSLVRTFINNDYGLSVDGTTRDLTNLAASLSFGRYIFGNQTVSYDADNHLLTMESFIGGSYEPPIIYSDSANVNLAALFGDSYYMGFTGATGVASSVQRITAFDLSVTPLAAVPEPESYALLLAGLGLMGTVARRRRQGAVAA